MAQREPALICRDLTVLRGGRAVLDQVSFELCSGEVTGLFGPSGCGKTTLMRSIVGLQRSTRGAITVLGRPAGDPPLRSHVAYTTQAPSIYADLSVHENFRYFARIVGASSRRVAETIDEVGLQGLDRRVVATLSGGEIARVSLGVALLGDAEMLVLDEPTVGLDPLLRLDLWQLFRTIAARRRSLLVSSHVLDEATHCDRLILLREGRVLAFGAPRAICAQAGAASIEQAFIALVRGGTPSAR
jgi:ABC-2 type transport system ATP-binding protein